MGFDASVTFTKNCADVEPEKWNRKRSERLKDLIKYRKRYLLISFYKYKKRAILTLFEN